MLGVGAGEGEGAVTAPLDSVVINHRLKREKAVMLSSWSEKYSPPVSRHKTDFYSSIAHNYVKIQHAYLYSNLRVSPTQALLP